MSRPRYVLDASALLCVLFEENGAAHVAERLTGALVSVVSHSEVVAKLIDRGLPPDRVAPLLADLDIELVPFDRAQAEAAGLLRARTRDHGLSLGDRACMALAHARSATALTTDRAWADLDAGVAIEFAR